MIAALLLGLLLAIHHGATNLGEVISLSATILGVSLFAAAVGKVAGIAVSRALWYLERYRLLRRLTDPKEGGGNVVLR
jgi:uncharacterized transporter YbjL